MNNKYIDALIFDIGKSMLQVEYPMGQESS